MHRRMAMLLMSFFLASAACAQDYPSKPLRLVVPFAPGGLTDVIGRSIGERLGEVLGQTVVIVNRPGAGGNIGADLVAKAEPDGYTLLLTTHLLALNQSTYRNISYDLERDLEPVGEIGSSVNGLVVRPTLPVSNVAELIALMKAQPDAINVAAPGSGPTMPYFAMVSGTRFTVVNYKGNGPAITDMVAGRVDLMNVAMETVLPYLESGQLKVLAITSSVERSALFPDVPAMAETLPGFAAPGFAGLTVPRGTPRDIVLRLNGALQKVLADPGLRERYAKAAIEITGGSPEAFAQRIHGEVVRWAPVVAATQAYVN